MKTEEVAEKARELYPFNECSPDAEFDAYIKGHEDGKAEANAEWQEKVRWKSVDEKLPEKDKNVLCKIKLFNSMNIYYGICLFLSKNEWINMGNTSYSNFETSVSKVTHWREII